MSYLSDIRTKANFLVVVGVLSLGWGMDPVSVTEEDKKYMKQCSNCSSWSPLASEVCTSCGGKEFSDYEASKKKNGRRQLEQTIAPPVEMRKVCKTCGTSNPEYVKNYCVKCGARL